MAVLTDNDVDCLLYSGYECMGLVQRLMMLVTDADVE